jgi:mycofactocin precursor
MPDTAVIEHLSRPAGSPPLRSPEAEPPPEDLVEDELLVEDVSIDGMCGVY